MSAFFPSLLLLSPSKTSSKRAAHVYSSRPKCRTAARATANAGAGDGVRGQLLARNDRIKVLDVVCALDRRR